MELRSDSEEIKILSAIEEKLTPAYQLNVAKGGHDISHILRMLKIADTLTKDSKTMELFPVNPFLLKIAIWFHNIDRTSYFKFSSQGEKTSFIEKTLSDLELLKKETELIIDVVLKHSWRNDESDSSLLVLLRDTDMLDIGAVGVFRIAAHHDIPHYNLEDFKGKSPADADEKLESHIEDVKFCLEWEDMIRTPGGRKLGQKRFAFMKTFLQEVKRELKEIDIIP